MVHDSDIKNTALAAWLGAASTGIKARLCELADTSDSMFRQWVSGRRKLSAEKAGAVEAAMLALSRDDATAPPALSRGDLCDACRKCPYYKAVEEAGEAGEAESLDILNK